MAGLGIFCLKERDVSKLWNNLFHVTGYISFFFCVMFLITFNNTLLTDYFFNLSIYLVYLISIIYVIIKTTIQSNDRK